MSTWIIVGSAVVPVGFEVTVFLVVNSSVPVLATNQTFEGFSVSENETFVDGWVQLPLPYAIAEEPLHQKLGPVVGQPCVAKV